jgi:histidinol-phosphate aminotransferase
VSRVVTTRIRSLAGYEPGEQPRSGSPLVKLNTNENPYPASPAVARAVEQACHLLHLYPDPVASGVRRSAAARFQVEPENVLVGNGSDEILSLCVKACAEPGDRIAYPVPTYSLYRTLAELSDCNVVETPARTGTMPAALSHADASITFLCTPNSPLGYEIGSEQIRRVASATAGLVVVDEAYVDFGETSAIGLLAEFDNVLVLRTLSKSFSLAGARIGLAIARADLIAELTKVKDSYNVSRLAQAAGQAALDDIDWMRGNVDRIVRTRERVRGELLRLGLDVPSSSANFLWVDCGALGGLAAYRGLRERGILVRFFDEPMLSAGVRVTIGTDDQMNRFLEAIAAVVATRTDRSDPVRA